MCECVCVRAYLRKRMSLCECVSKERERVCVTMGVRTCLRKRMCVCACAWYTSKRERERERESVCHPNSPLNHSIHFIHRVPIFCSNFFLPDFKFKFYEIVANIFKYLCSRFKRYYSILKIIYKLNY